MKNVMKMLQEKVQIQEARIVDLKKEIKELKNGNELESSKRIMTASRRQEGEAKQLQFRSPKHQESEVIDVQEDGVKQERPQVRIVPALTESVVAFYAYMSTTESNPSTHHTIIYDHEVTNIGNGYNRHSGTFIAPVDGVYVFSWTIFMSVPGEYMSIELTLNSQPVGASFVHGMHDYSSVSDPEKEIKVSQKRGQRIEQTENDEETETGWRKEESNIYLQNHKRHEIIFIQQDILVIQERPHSFEEYRCEGDIRIDGETEVFVTYSGGKIDSLCYVMRIMGRDAQNLKRYRLCLETLVYSDPDCELLVGLIGSDPQKSATDPSTENDGGNCIIFSCRKYCNTISWDEFEQVKHAMKMLHEKVKSQMARIIDLEKEIEELKNGDKGLSKRAMTESRRQDEKEKQPPPHSYNH
uniref:C1q domain-containing protein n=1 Tax=Magallana gigas TaxID=29159 RepID=A0A8W8M301_MAGGI